MTEILNYLQLIDDLEAQLRAGQLLAVTTRLKKLPPLTIPREHALKIANVARRAGLVLYGLKLLAPVVRGRSGLQHGPPKPEEWAEYAVLLQRSGAVKEALRIWESRELKDSQNFGLQKALCYFNIWDHARAIPLLEKQLKQNPSDYESMIIRTNLAAALLLEDRWDDSLKHSQQLELELSGTSNHRLLANNLELQASVFSERGEWNEARERLNRAALFMKSASSTDQLFIAKGLARIDAYSSGDPTSLLKFREEAQKRHHFESVRDADRLILLQDFDEKRFRFLYFGTPWPAYRERLVRSLRFEPEGELFQRGPDDAAASLHLGQGVFERVTGGPQESWDGGKSLRLLQSLGKDFYKPMNAIGLFSEVYPQENFDPESSIDRIHQLIRRTRQFLRAENLPLWIEVRKNQYRLQWEQDLKVFFPRTMDGTSWEELQMQKLQSAFSADSLISSQEACEKTGLSAAQFRRLKTWAETHGALVRVGRGAKSFYRVSRAG